MSDGSDFAGLDDVAYWRPHPDLAPYVSGYHFYRVRAVAGETARDVFFPSWSLLRFSFDHAPWSVRIGRRTFSPVPAASLAGPSSHAGYVEATRGVLVGMGLLPAGWARLFGGDLSRFADRIVPLDQILPDAYALGEAARAACREGGSPAPAFDRFLLGRLAAAEPEDPAVARLHAMLTDPAVDRAAQVADALGLTARALLALTRRHFGFAPKLLLRRARFLRALFAAAATERGRWADAVRDAGYFDASHFTRDCQLFLDRSLGEFLGMRRPLNAASMRKRAEVLGAPMQAVARPVLAGG